MSDVYSILKTLSTSIKGSKGGLSRLCSKYGWNYSTYAQKFNADDASNYPSAHEIILAMIFSEDDSVLYAIKSQKEKTPSECHVTTTQKTIRELAEAIAASSQLDYVNADTQRRNEIDKELMEARDAIDTQLISNSKIKNNMVAA